MDARATGVNATLRNYPRELGDNYFRPIESTEPSTLANSAEMAFAFGMRQKGKITTENCSFLGCSLSRGFPLSASRRAAAMHAGAFMAAN